MIIELSNIGPVKNMKLDLSKPLITFMGLNGTGKTYVSYIIYSLLRGFKSNFSILKESVSEDPDTISGALNMDDFYACLNEQIVILNAQISHLFNLSEEDEQFKDASVEIVTSKEELSEAIKNEDFGITVEDFFSFKKDKDGYGFTIKKLNRDHFEKADMNFMSMFIFKIMVYGSPTASMLTAERNGIYTFSRELSINRFLSSSYPNSQFPSQRYPQPIVDAILEANDLSFVKKQKSRTSKLAASIESEILFGEMTVSNDGDLLFKSKKMKKELAFSLASSAVKTVAPITIFLKHVAIFNQMLIIDEPELNLHPKNQILLARIFAKMVNAGIRLIINTHSDYILRELNSLIMLSSVNETTRKKLKYAKDEKIHFNDVGVYEFHIVNATEHGVVVKEIPVSETGFDSVLIDEVINKQMNVAQDIYLAVENFDEQIES